jgi:hypothetical protein
MTATLAAFVACSTFRGIVHVPPVESTVVDRQLMRETGRRLAEAYLKDPPLLTGL